ncbi:unknown [Prevotella sp. CAG:1031]|jgi:hypothetical protein|nr:unknown [Prevotella sp. CAG:1031]
MKFMKVTMTILFSIVGALIALFTFSLIIFGLGVKLIMHMAHKIR